MPQIERVHCNIKHVDAHLIRYEDGKLKIKCPQRPYCDDCPFERGEVPRRIRI